MTTSSGKFLPPLRRLPSLIPIGLASIGGGGAPSNQFNLPGSASGSIPALTSTFALTSTPGGTEGWTPANIMTVIPNNAASPPTYSLIGAQAGGFDVVNSGNNATIRFASRYKVHDVGALNNLGATRTFTLRGVLGPVTSDCTITVTLTTAGYTLPCTMPYLQTPTGRTSGAPLVAIQSVMPLTGWTISGGIILTPTQNSPAPLTNYLIEGLVIQIYDRTGIVIDQCKFKASNALGFGQNNGALCRSDCPGNSISNTTFDMDTDNVNIGLNALIGNWDSATNLAIIGAQNDGIDIANNGSLGGGLPVGSNIYLSTSSNYKYQNDGNPQNDTYSWGHSDGVQTWGLRNDFLLDSFFINNPAQPYKDGVIPRTPAGTTSFVQGQNTLVGVGTQWKNGSAADKLNVGDVIRFKGADLNVVVTAVTDDTHITIGSFWQQTTVNNIAIVAFSFADAMCGITSPVYANTVAGVTQPGTVNFASGSPNVVGTGTAFGQHLVNQTINNGNEIYTILSVADATHLTLTTNASVTRNGTTCKTGYPLQGKSLIFQNGVALGGAYPIQSNSYATEGVPTNGLVKWKNVAIGDYRYGAVKNDSSLVTSATVQGVYNILTGAPVSDIRPLPTARTLTPGSTTSSSVSFSFTSQDASIVYEYRYRTTAGPGVWSGWSAATPAGTTISGLSSSTSYDIELRGSNCQGTDGNYYQVVTVASASYSTAAGGGVTKVILLNAGTTSWTVPADWTTANTVECIGGGAGGNGASTASGGISATGGGAGAYAKISGISAATLGGIGASVPVSIGAAGAAGPAGTGTSDMLAGNGGDTWFNATSLANAQSNGPTVSCAAQGGKAPTAFNVAGVGGAAASSVGTTKFSGGNGGINSTGSPAFDPASGSGGGAAGPNGAGGAGAGGPGGSSVAGGSGGGASDGGTAGSAGGSSAGGNGGTHSGGSGGGGGGIGSAGGAGVGGNGGGGGGGNNVGSGGAGGAGGAPVIWTSSPGGVTAGPGGGGGSGGAVNAAGLVGGVGGAGGAYGGGGGGGGGNTNNPTTVPPGGAGAAGLIVITYTT